MSLWRSLGLALVGIWLVVSVCYAVVDIITLADPNARRAERVCTDERYGRGVVSVELSDFGCLPRLAARGGLDATLVGLPAIFGWALASRRRR